MSLAAAIGQIDSILQLQQQVANPSTALSSLSTGTSTSGSSTTGSSSTTASSFAEMLAGAQTQDTADAIGDGTSTDTSLSDPLTSGLLDSLTGSTGTTTTTGGVATDGLSTTTGTDATTATTATTSGTPSAVSEMTSKANSLLGKPYVWGGGHSGWGEQTGYDCSGFVSAVLHAGGYLSSPQDTQTLPSQAGIESGAGKYVTIYDRTDAGSGQDHVIIDLNGQFYESGGGHGAWGGGGGVEKIDKPSAAYLASFNLKLHPQGL